jgi:F-type H+-transporting ATPase subunit a
LTLPPVFPQEHGAAQEAAGEAHGEVFNLGDMLAHHILNAPEYELPFLGAVHFPHWDWAVFHIGGLTIDLSPTKHMVLLLLAAVITAAMTLFAARTVARQGSGRAPKGLANAVEAVVVFLRDDLCKEFIGKGYERFVPLILTQFFFILTMNLLGLVPWGGAASGNLAVTAMLALITFVVVEVSGFRTLGPAGYMRTIFFAPPGTTGAVKYLMLAIMTPVELLGKLTKPFALAIRLFANMTAGHMMIFTLIGFIFIFGHIAFGRWVVAAGSYAFVSAILLLELLIAFIQAYIFAMLSAVFIGLMRHEH